MANRCKHLIDEDLSRRSSLTPSLVSGSSFKSGTSVSSFIQTSAPPNTMIESCLTGTGKGEPIKQNLINALRGLSEEK